MNQYMKLVSVKWTGDELCVGNNFLFFLWHTSSDFITSLLSTQALQLLIYRCSPKNQNYSNFQKETQVYSTFYSSRHVKYWSRQIPRDALIPLVPSRPVPSRLVPSRGIPSRCPPLVRIPTRGKICFSCYTLFRVECEELFCKTNIRLLKQQSAVIVLWRAVAQPGFVSRGANHFQ